MSDETSVACHGPLLSTRAGVTIEITEIGASYIIQSVIINCKSIQEDLVSNGVRSIVYAVNTLFPEATIVLDP